MLAQIFRRFEDGDLVTALGFDIVIRRRSAGHLLVPSGELVACDPLTYLDTEPFALQLTPGSYPVLLFGAELRDDTRLAYVMVEVSDEETVRWERARVQSDAHPSLLDGPDAGFPVESDVACFLDAHTAGVLLNYTQSLMEEDELERAARGAMSRQQKQGLRWANLNLRRHLDIATAEDMNLVLFEPGNGSGLFETWIGLDRDDQITHIVTDCGVLKLHFKSFRSWK